MKTQSNKQHNLKYTDIAMIVIILAVIFLYGCNNDPTDPQPKIPQDSIPVDTIPIDTIPIDTIPTLKDTIFIFNDSIVSYDSFGVSVDDFRNALIVAIPNETDRTQIAKITFNTQLAEEQLQHIKHLNKYNNDYDILFSALEEISLPNQTGELPSSCFMNCPWLKTFSADKIEGIGDGTFMLCPTLVNINLPSVIYTSSHSFHTCGGMLIKSISLPSAIDIGEFTFAGCYLDSVNLPSAKNIGDYAFMACAFQYVNLPSAKNIGSRAFSRCRELRRISLPVAENIGNLAFSMCSKLDYLLIGGATINWGSKVFDGEDPLAFKATDPTKIRLYLHSNEYNNVNGNWWNGYKFWSISKIE